MSDYQHKPEDYYRHARVDVLQLLQGKTGLSILEIGAGGGFTLAEAKRSGVAGYVAGVELFRLPGMLQESPVLDEFHFADLNDTVPELRKNQFDVLLCLDVLEHLVEPWAVLEKWSGMIGPGGMLIVSIPNIREISVMWKVFGKGNFGYTVEGILDRTHLRFFGKRNLFDLPSHAQFEAIKVLAALRYQGGSPKRKIVNRITFGLFEQFLTHQWYVVATRRG